MRRIDYSTLTERRCSKCKVMKPVADFNRYTDPSQPICGWRYYSQCRECQNAASREYGAANKPRRNERLRAWRKANPDMARAKDRRARLSSKYGLTEDDLAALMARFDGKCWVCRRKQAKAVDHDHRTGAVRGVLCHGCNTVAVARADDDPDFIAHLIEYFEQPCHADILLELATPGLRSA